MILVFDNNLKKHDNVHRYEGFGIQLDYFYRSFKILRAFWIFDRVMFYAGVISVGVYLFKKNQA